MKRARDGITGSTKVVRTAYNPSPQTRSVNPSAANQLGMAMGTLPGQRYSAPKLYDGGPVLKTPPLGNTLTNNVGTGGPGKGREIMLAGTQGTYGGVAGERPGPARGIDERGRLKP